MRQRKSARKLKIYWRDTGSARRAYGDFRGWADVGGAREPLVPEGGTLATTDAEEAGHLYIDRTAELNDLREKKKVLGAVYGIQATAGLKAYAAHHLRMKALSGGVTDRWLDASENHLRAAVEFFGAEKELHEIRVSDIQRYSGWLQTQPVWRGAKLATKRKDRRTLSGGSVRKYLNTLSNLFKRAQAEEVVPLGHNPV
ncbi:MAG: hypothetical protein GEU90_18620, partial [Gemmatimonas sp.]|nr:hypothetical protein [Gemmatimonas sp.]